MKIRTISAFESRTIRITITTSRNPPPLSPPTRSHTSFCARRHSQPRTDQIFLTIWRRWSTLVVVALDLHVGPQLLIAATNEPSWQEAANKTDNARLKNYFLGVKFVASSLLDDTHPSAQLEKLQHLLLRFSSSSPKLALSICSICLSSCSLASCRCTTI